MPNHRRIQRRRHARNTPENLCAAGPEGPIFEALESRQLYSANIAPTFAVENSTGFDTNIISDTAVGAAPADGATSVISVDLDGDGDIDVLSTSSNDDTVAFFDNDGNENFTRRVVFDNDNSINSLDSLDGPSSVTAGDIDGDGDIDLLVSAANDDRIGWLENDGNEVFTLNVIDSNLDSIQDAILADVDGDGDLDALSASSVDDTIAWFQNDGTGVFTRINITTDAEGANSVAAADLDGDGDLDVLSSSGFDDTIAWYENDGSENFTKRVISINPNNPQSVAVADVDGDGDLDVLSASIQDSRLAWYENDGLQNFTERIITNDANGARSVATADFDNDGDVDIALALANDNAFAVYENDGSQNFTKTVLTSSAQSARRVSVGDVNQDGFIDVLGAANLSDTITLFQNRVEGFNSLDGNPTFVENGTPVILDDDVEIFDAELSADDNFSGAELTLLRNVGANGDDVFSFEDGAGITRSGLNLIKNGQSIATFDTTTSGQLVITFTDGNGETPTNDDVNAIMRQIAYENTSATPPASVSIDWTFSDENAGAQGTGGAAAAFGSTTVDIMAAANIAPSGADTTLTTNEDTAHVFARGDFGFTDAEPDNFDRVVITTLPAAGLLFSGRG